LHTSLGIPSHLDLLSALQFALMQELSNRKIALKE
jgi:hypothetical protein